MEGPERGIAEGNTQNPDVAALLKLNEGRTQKLQLAPSPSSRLREESGIQFCELTLDRELRPRLSRERFSFSISHQVLPFPSSLPFPTTAISLMPELNRQGRMAKTINPLPAGPDRTIQLGIRDEGQDSTLLKHQSGLGIEFDRSRHPDPLGITKLPPPASRRDSRALRMTAELSKAAPEAPPSDPRLRISIRTVSLYTSILQGYTHTHAAVRHTSPRHGQASGGESR
jgi:hypothetical protein